MEGPKRLYKEIFIYLDMAHVKAGGVAKGNKDSVSKRLGVKVYGGQFAKAGSIIIRQKGTKVYPGVNVSMGKDFTIASEVSGKVQFGVKNGKKIVSVLPA
jgi:large subunit ribosomal protein L27